MGRCIVPFSKNDLKMKTNTFFKDAPNRESQIKLGIHSIFFARDKAKKELASNIQ